MVQFTVLASGSKGNSCVISAGRTRLLVDAGLSCREIFRRMRQVDLDPGSLDAILVTHEHQDHIQGLSVIARKLNIPVYFTVATHRAWRRWIAPPRTMTYRKWVEEYHRQRNQGVVGLEPGPDRESATAQSTNSSPLADTAVVVSDAESHAPASDVGANELADTAHSPKDLAGEAALADLPRVEYFRSGEPFAVGDIDISPFTVSHDAADPVGFVFAAEGVRMAIATDLGYMAPNVKAQLRNCDLLMIESNHDLDMLRDGPYPWQVKQRVLSRVGHLSNEATAEFLEQSYDGQARWVILAHLSESNNLPELARIAAERALASHAGLLANRLLLAAQHEPLLPVSF